jgi:hypothetical protein
MSTSRILFTPADLDIVFQYLEHLALDKPDFYSELLSGQVTGRLFQTKEIPGRNPQQLNDVFFREEIANAFDERIKMMTTKILTGIDDKFVPQAMELSQDCFSQIAELDRWKSFVLTNTSSNQAEVARLTDIVMGAIAYRHLIEWSSRRDFEMKVNSCDFTQTELNTILASLAKVFISRSKIEKTMNPKLLDSLKQLHGSLTSAPPERKEAVAKTLLSYLSKNYKSDFEQSYNGSEAMSLLLDLSKEALNNVSDDEKKKYKALTSLYEMRAKEREAMRQPDEPKEVKYTSGEGRMFSAPQMLANPVLVPEKPHKVPSEGHTARTNGTKAKK